MSTIIMDLCSYTRLGLTGYLTSRGIRKRDISEVQTAASLKESCESSRPAVVFLNEDCFIHREDSNQLIRQIITDYPGTLFVIFMALANVHFDHYLLVRKNLLISSKSLTPKDLDDILGNHLKYDRFSAGRINIPTLSLSRAESNMLQMWMAGHGTSQISTQMTSRLRPFRRTKAILKRKSRPTINR
nr:Colanic acid capsular biosynthesis activation accesory protein RcsA [Raoultella sp. NCTC 9187]